MMLTGQLGQVHCPEGQLQVPDDEHPQSLMVRGGLTFFGGFFFSEKQKILDDRQTIRY